LIELRGLEFRYPSTAGFRIAVPELDLAGGDCVAVVGPSGSGKTTLLGLLAGILKPAAGSLVVDGADLAMLNERQRRQFRIRNVGQVFQAFELLHYLSVIENVLLPHFIQASEMGTREMRRRALQLLSDVGLADKADAWTSELSQGEQQRVAVCRAMLNRPALLLADEPTGNLDQANKQNVVDILLKQARANHSTLVMVTHDRSLLASFSTVLDIQSVVSAQPGLEAQAV
jgi:putative ABC transport system ATP-binding protein